VGRAGGGRGGGGGRRGGGGRGGRGEGRGLILGSMAVSLPGKVMMPPCATPIMFPFANLQKEGYYDIYGSIERIIPIPSYRMKPTKVI